MCPWPGTALGVHGGSSTPAGGYFSINTVKHFSEKLRGFRAEVGETRICCQTYRGLSSSHFQAPAMMHRSRRGRKKPKHRPQKGVMTSPAPLPTRESQSEHVSGRHYRRVGSSFRRSKKTNRTFYILHYTWLCTTLLIPWWWCPCMEYLVFGFLKTAWNKMYNSQSYLCFFFCLVFFATVVTKLRCCSIISPVIWFYHERVHTPVQKSYISDLKQTMIHLYHL